MIFPGKRLTFLFAVDFGENNSSNVELVLYRCCRRFELRCQTPAEATPVGVEIHKHELMIVCVCEQIVRTEIILISLIGFGQRQGNGNFPIGKPLVTNDDSQTVTHELVSHDTY